MVISYRLEVLLKESRIIWIGQLAPNLVDTLHSMIAVSDDEHSYADRRKF